MTLAISGMRRPNRSDSTPKSSAPIGRNASVAVVVKIMAFLDTLNSLDNVSYKKTITKKSNASSVQPRNPARTACCVPAFRRGGVIRLDAPLVGFWHKPIRCHTAGRECQPHLRRDSVNSLRNWLAASLAKTALFVRLSRAVNAARTIGL